MKRSLSLKLTIIVVVVLLTSLLTTGCLTREKNEEVTEQAIILFHEQFNAENYDALYENTHGEFKQTQKKEEVIPVFKQLRNDFGKFVEIKDKRINVINSKPVQVRVAYVSKFEKTDATELFSFVREDGKLKLSYYSLVKGVTDINSEADKNNK